MYTVQIYTCVTCIYISICQDTFKSCWLWLSDLTWITKTPCCFEIHLRTACTQAFSFIVLSDRSFLQHISAWCIPSLKSSSKNSSNCELTYDSRPLFVLSSFMMFNSLITAHSVFLSSSVPTPQEGTMFQSYNNLKNKACGLFESQKYLSSVHTEPQTPWNDLILYFT